MITVTALSVTPVKGTRLLGVSELDLVSTGAPSNRRFYLVDERGRMLNGKVLGELQAVIAVYDAGADQLRLTFPDGSVVRGVARPGEEVQARFYSRPRTDREVKGPFSQALSDYLGRKVRVLDAGERGAVDRGGRGGVSLMSRASLERLAAEGAVGAVDGRRFRMLIEVDGVGAHEEDGWVGGRVRLGEAEVAFIGHVGRCLITNRHPETGESDLPTLDLLLDYRAGASTTEPVAFGIFGQVLRPGRIRLGDTVAPVSVG